MLRQAMVQRTLDKSRVLNIYMAAYVHVGLFRVVRYDIKDAQRNNHAELVYDRAVNVE